MTPQNLMDYVKVYKDFIDRDICKGTVQKLNEANWTEHAFYEAKTDKLISYDNELSISHDSIPEKYIITKQVWSALEQYVLKDFASFDEWFPGWNGYSEIRFNRYDPSTQMKIHCDHINSMFDGPRKGVPVLTILGSLNDDYEGGELIMFGDKKIELPAGSVTVFPSNFMYPHEVKPVKSGIRYSYVSWAW